ncbi:Lrp/AsnC family transcriptional regulator [Spirochaeta isovalerica]|uniref:Lrp/AsnC family transcriptional regulator for asnA, asnC and gidA n=1 Tax=Spirochaeta isovalerica TaxID=150 RepID=A0A841RG17_9SPIO|nr:Lrp/AsnC family transcriptional regulator [Spirochaeta isovalerica]MBB6482157.1 Lrp/AsnC family transcriptional regulator for asnA, asnC and gidA [Spirochaeta isovalerica]MBN2657961.1 Lrp/AsnC family transcriptional regulator [Spirochaetales bacterium]
MQPDEIDWKIIDILREKFVPNNAIARELGVSEGMIRQRVKRLKEAGILRIRALINPDVLENLQLALVAVNITESSLLKKKADQIANLENVLSVSFTSGRYDLFVEVLVSSNRDLVRFLTEELPNVEGVTNSETFMMLRSYNKFV